MNFQPLIDNAHLILPGLALLVGSLGLLFFALGRVLPGNDFFEKNAHIFDALSKRLVQGLEWQSKAGEIVGGKAAKSAQVALQIQKLLKEGKYVEAFTLANGFFISGAKKAGLPDPFASTLALPQSTTPSLPAAGENELDPDPTTHLDDTPAS